MIASAEDNIRRRAHTLTTARQHTLRGRWAQLLGMRDILGQVAPLFFAEAHMRSHVDEGAFAAAMRADLRDQTMLEVSEVDAEGLV